MKEIKVKTVNVSLDELMELVTAEANRIHQHYLKEGNDRLAEIRDEIYRLNEWWSLEEVARYFNVTPETVRKVYVNQGLKHAKVGQYLRFNRQDVYDWQEENRVSKKAA